MEDPPPPPPALRHPSPPVILRRGRPAAAELCAVIATPGTGLVWTPALPGHAALRGPAHDHGGFCLLWASRVLAPHRSHTGPPASTFRGSLCCATTSITGSVDQGPGAYSLLVIPDPLRFINEAFPGTAEALGGFGRTQTARGKGGPARESRRRWRWPLSLGPRLEFGPRGALLSLLSGPRSPEWEVPSSALKDSVPCLGFPISKAGMSSPPCHGCCKFK